MQTELADKKSVKFVVRIHQKQHSYGDLRTIFQEADRLGYYGASLWDLLNAPSLECWTTLTALAVETQRLHLIPLVLANLYRHPTVLAKMAATLDIISKGRVDLGIGAGGNGPDHTSSGLAFPSTSQRVAILEEAVQIIKSMWTGLPTSFAGHYYSVDGAICDPPPMQSPRPNILIGGHGETHLLRAVAAHADVTNIGFDMSLTDHELKKVILNDHCRVIGREFSEIQFSHNANILIAETSSNLDAMISSSAQQQGVTPKHFRHSLGNAVIGTPEQCGSQIQRYVDAGIRYFFLLFPHPIELRSLQLFAREVMPSFVQGT